MKRLAVTLSIALAMITSTALITGCNKGTKGPDKSNAKWTIGFSQCNSKEPWREQMNRDIQKAVDKNKDLKVIIKDASNDASKQRSQVEEFISQGVDLIIITPKESAPLTAVVKQAYDKGIPVIVLDRKVNTENYTCFIGPNNYRIGKAAGEWIVKNLKKDAKIVELKGLMTSTPAQGRHNGFRDAIKGSSLKVIFEEDMEWDQAKAQKAMESALQRFKEIDCVYAHNDPAALGAYQAAKRENRQKDIIFVGIDGLKQEGQALVKRGKLSVSFEYPTGGNEAVQTAYEILQGKTVPKVINLPSKFFTKENIEKGGQWVPGCAPEDVAPKAPAKKAPAAKCGCSKKAA